MSINPSFSRFGIDLKSYTRYTTTSQLASDGTATAAETANTTGIDASDGLSEREITSIMNTYDTNKNDILEKSEIEKIDNDILKNFLEVLSQKTTSQSNIEGGGKKVVSKDGNSLTYFDSNGTPTKNIERVPGKDKDGNDITIYTITEFKDNKKIVKKYEGPAEGVNLVKANNFESQVLNSTKPNARFKMISEEQYNMVNGKYSSTASSTSTITDGKMTTKTGNTTEIFEVDNLGNIINGSTKTTIVQDGNNFKVTTIKVDSDGNPYSNNTPEITKEYSRAEYNKLKNGNEAIPTKTTTIYKDKNDDIITAKPRETVTVSNGITKIVAEVIDKNGNVAANSNKTITIDYPAKGETPAYSDVIDITYNDSEPTSTLTRKKANGDIIVITKKGYAHQNISSFILANENLSSNANLTYSKTTDSNGITTIRSLDDEGNEEITKYKKINDDPETIAYLDNDNRTTKEIKKEKNETGNKYTYTITEYKNNPAEKIVKTFEGPSINPEDLQSKLDSSSTRYQMKTEAHYPKTSGSNYSSTASSTSTVENGIKTTTETKTSGGKTVQTITQVPVKSNGETKAGVKTVTEITINPNQEITGVKVTTNKIASNGTSYDTRTPVTVTEYTGAEAQKFDNYNPTNIPNEATPAKTTKTYINGNGDIDTKKARTITVGDKTTAEYLNSDGTVDFTQPRTITYTHSNYTAIVQVTCNDPAAEQREYTSTCTIKDNQGRITGKLKRSGRYDSETSFINGNGNAVSGSQWEVRYAYKDDATPPSVIKLEYGEDGKVESGTLKRMKTNSNGNFMFSGSTGTVQTIGSANQTYTLVTSGAHVGELRITPTPTPPAAEYISIDQLLNLSST